MRHVFFAMPCYSGRPWMQTMRCLFRDMLALGEQGVMISFDPLLWSPNIAYIRARFVQMFLDSDATDLVFIDDDMAWDEGAIERLLLHSVDVVGADYPRRMLPISYSARLLQRDGQWDATPNENGLLEVETLPFGMFRLTRRAVERMIKAYPELKFTEGWALFHHMLDGQHIWEEDFSFCKRWRDTGGAVWVDTEIKAYHLGVWTYSGEYRDWLKLAASLPLDQSSTRKD